MTTTQTQMPLPKRNTGEIRGFEKQVNMEGRMKTTAGYNASIATWIQAEQGLRSGRTYFYVSGSATVTPAAPITIKYEMEEYETAQVLTNGAKATAKRTKKDKHGRGIVESISLVSPTEWFSALMKGTYSIQQNRRIPRLDDDGKVMKDANGNDCWTYEYYTTEHPITIQHIIGHGYNTGVTKLINDLDIMVAGRTGYPFINYITQGNTYHSNCRSYGASTPWGQIQGGDYTRSGYDYNTNHYKRSNQVQVMGELDEEFMANYAAWKALYADLAALTNVDNIKQLKSSLESSTKNLSTQQTHLKTVTAKWTEEYMMAYAIKERDQRIHSQTQQVKYARENLESNEKRLKAAEEKDTTSVTALQKAHFGKVFRKAKVTNDE